MQYFLADEIVCVNCNRYVTFRKIRNKMWIYAMDAKSNNMGASNNVHCVAGCAWQVDTSGRRGSKPKAGRVTNPSSSYNVIVHLETLDGYQVRSFGL